MPGDLPVNVIGCRIFATAPRSLDIAGRLLISSTDIEIR